MIVLEGEQSILLNLLSVSIAMIAAFMAIQLVSVAAPIHDRLMRRSIVTGAVVVLGAGIWSMHFIGMLALDLCRSAEYDEGILLVSMAPAFVASWVTIAVLIREKTSNSNLLLGSCIVSLAIAVMHFSGITAAKNYFEIRVTLEGLLLALFLGAILAFAALKCFRNSRQKVGKGIPMALRCKCVPAAFLAAAIVAVHHIGMWATVFLVTDPEIDIPETDIFLIPIVALITISCTVIAAAFSISSVRQASREQSRIQTILETAVDGVITIDRQGRICSFNRAAESIFGWTAEEVMGNNVSILMPEPDRSAHDGYLSNYLTGGQPRIIGIGREVLGLRKTGEQFPMRLAIGETKLADETLFVGFVTDVSERRAIEEALRNREQQYRSLISNLPGVAFRCHLDDDWTVLFISDAIETISGYSAQDFVERRITFNSLIHSSDQLRVAMEIRRALKDGRHYSIQYRLITKDGAERWVSENGCGVYNQAGEVEWIDGIIIDDTENLSRNAEAASLARAMDHSLAILQLSPDGYMLDANENFLTLMGYTGDALVGLHHKMLWTDADIEAGKFDTLWNTLRAGCSVSGEFHRKGANGQDVWLYASYNPVVSPDGQISKFVKFATDLTERHAIEQRLLQAKFAAERAAMAKANFLANMSHEIRTPMNAVIGFTDVLISEISDPRLRGYLKTMRNSARSLLALLNDILDTAKLERGAIQIERGDFSCRDLCQHVIALLTINAEAKGLALTLEYAEDCPDYFCGDRNRLQQVLLNLVGNAVKFTEQGQVSLRVSYAMGALDISIIDTGIGIPEDRLALIFDPFAQADASVARKFGGTGLGTTIARQLVELMGGTISVESQLGWGSRFSIRLPLMPGKPVPRQSDPKVSLPPLRILIADDVPQNIELLEAVLGPDGHVVTAVSNGDEAVQAYKTGSYDVILMDIRMPGMDGLSATRAIRAWEGLHKRRPTPVIALTASVFEEDRRAIENAGMNGFLAKPVEPYRLRVEILRCIGMGFDARAERVAQPLQAELALSAPALLTIDREAGARNWGSESLFLTSLSRFLADQQGLQERLLRSAAKPEMLAGELHRLRGAALNLGLAKFASMLADLERVLISGGDPLPHLSPICEEFDRIMAELPPQMSRSIASAASDLPVSLADARRLLDSIDNSLARGEWPEESITLLANFVSGEQLDLLHEAMQVFDFDRARLLLGMMSEHLNKEVRTP